MSLIFLLGVCSQLFWHHGHPAMVTHGRVCIWTFLGMGTKSTIGAALWHLLDCQSHLGSYRGLFFSSLCIYLSRDSLWFNCLTSFFCIWLFKRFA